jgi:Bacterial conjugation TrbI-like protein
MSIPKLRPWHWVLIALALVLSAGFLLANQAGLLGSFFSGDVAKNVRSEYAVRKSGARWVSTPQVSVATSSPSPTLAPSPTALPLAAGKGSLTIASATPSPASPDNETLDLTKPSSQLAPDETNTRPGQRKELSEIPERPNSSANFTVPAKGNNDAALVVNSADRTSPPVPDSLLNQGYPGTSGNTVNGAVPNALTVTDPRRYLFNNLSPDALSGNSVVLSSDNGKDYTIAGFAPKSSIIKLAMLQAVSSADMELDVKAAVSEPFIFQGHQLLEIGDQLLGTAASSNKRDRILVTWHTILYKNGMSTSIDAVAQDPSGQIGIPGVQIGSRILQSITPVLLDTAAAFVQAFRQNAYTTIIPNNVSVGAVTVTNNQSAETQLTDAGLSSVQGGLDKISELIAADVESNKPYIFVMPGVKCQAYLRAPLDVTKRDYGN